MAPEDPRGWRLGGGVTYAALTTARLGLRTAAVVGVDGVARGATELDLLRAAGVDLMLVDLASGPVFHNVETPAGRVLVETGIGERISEKVRSMRAVQGDAILPALRRAGMDPATVDVVALSHLHFDHAGGLLDAGGRRAFPRATIVAQRAEWEVALDDNPRNMAGYDQPELRLVRDWAAEGAADGEREVLPGVSVVPTGGHTGGHQAVLVRGPRGTVAFFGDLAMRPWSANPRWVTAFDDFPLDSVVVKASLFARAADEGWTVVLSHEMARPIGRLVRDRDRFAWADRSA